MISNRIKKAAWYALATIVFIILLYAINSILFVVWQSAFTHADVTYLNKLFYGFIGAAITLCVVVVWAVKKGKSIKC